MSNKVSTLSAATLSDDERRDLIALEMSTVFGRDCSLRSIHSQNDPPTVEYAEYRRDTEGYRIWDFPVLKQVSFQISDNLAVTFGQPQMVVAKTVFEPITVSSFSLSESGSPSIEGDFVIYPAARLFSVGDYRDKGFPNPITTADLQRMVDTFSAENAKVNVEHEREELGTGNGTAELLSGELGNVRKVWVDDNGQWIRGEVAIPTWLDSALTKAGPEARQLSIEVQPHSMQLVGLALTKTPRCSGAALLSARADHRSNTPHAVQVPPSPKGKSPVENTLSEAQETRLFERLMAGVTSALSVFSKKKEDADTDQVTALAATVAQLTADRVNSEAVTFAESVIRAGRAFPTEKEFLVKSYIQAASDEQKNPTPATFTDASGAVKPMQSRVEIFRAGIEARPAFAAGLYQESLPQEATIHFSDSSAEAQANASEAASKRHAELLSLTALGRSTLANKEGK